LVQECYLKPEVKTNLTQITDEAIPETLNFIFTSVAKMDILINSLLQISRVGRVKMEIKNIDTNLLITNIIKQLNFQLSEISATVKVGKLPNCYGDENTLNQLFSNLLDNAIKYRNPNISLLVNIEGKVIYNKVIYSIKDNGIGIAAKYLNKIWDVFYRIDPSINENGEGIGLSIVKRIIDKHKGKIWVESEEGMGTTFYIELLIKEFEE
jgi:light-regulated signal transduction histidine kinase (bacteriophytochrome)